MLNPNSENLQRPALEGGQKTRTEFLVFGKPHFGPEEMNEVIDTLKSGWVGTGPRTAQFEKDFSTYIRGNSDFPVYSVGVNSCTAALHLALTCLDLKSDDEVIVPALTFCSSANAILHSGAVPVFADIDQERQCLTAATIEKAITPKTKAVVVVHFAGRAAPMDEILAVTKPRGIEIIEDCAHAVETEFEGLHAGLFGFAGCFSFYATKNVSCAEGGMFVTRNEKVAERARKLALHGLSKDAHKRFTATGYAHYDFDEVGFKYNMPDIAAAIGIHQLKRVEHNYLLRTAIWNAYIDGLKNLPIRLPFLPTDRSKERHALHLFQIRVDARVRDKLLSAYAAEGVGVGVHYLSLSKARLYQQFVRPGQSFEVAETIASQTISLPVGTAMTAADAEDAISATRKLLRYYLMEGNSNATQIS
ncbi:MAG: DegT/DnrJ/EryC1/StrS family aminotransferase [Bacteriovoracia bacterium]